MKAFMFFINAIYWLWIVVVPSAILGLLGFLLYERSKENLPYSILLTLIGLVLGIIWAERVRKKNGLSSFFSRIMSTPELDDMRNEEETIKAAPKDSL